MTFAPEIPEDDQTIDWWLDRTEEFAREFLDVDIRLRERFEIPADLPWPRAIPIFDPSGLTTFDAIQSSLVYQGMGVWSGVAGRSYHGFGSSNQPSLSFIEDSAAPNFDTFGKSGDELRAGQDESLDTFLSMRGYVFAAGLCYFARRQLLDADTVTIFPNDLLPGPGIRREATAFTADEEIRFSWTAPDIGIATVGARRVAQTKLRD
jgi:hypothetical protein